MQRSRLTLSFGERLDLDFVVGDEAPPSTEVVVVPQDVNLILGAGGVIEDTAETPEEVLAGAAKNRPRRPGSIVVSAAGDSSPLVLQAIVYDFERSPPSREEHVFEALLAAFEETKRRGLSSLAVQPLGTAHSGLPPSQFLKVLTQICYSSAELGTSLRQVHVLLSSPEELNRYEELLRHLVDKRGRRG